ncbi:hypothetical protein PSYMO_37786, partial [Pseudomonas amygdali pv. mori str. 301020]
KTVNMVIKNSVSHGNGLDGFVADHFLNLAGRGLGA